MKHKVFKLFLLILSLVIGYLLYTSILLPSYISYTSVCKKEIFEEKFPTYSVEGNVSVVKGEIIVQIIYPSERVIKHEWVHVRQLQSGFPSLSCSKPVQKYMSEIEAYSSEKLSNPIYNLVYGEPKI